MFDCENCGKSFTRSDNKNRHMQSSCRGKRLKLDDDIDEHSNCLKCDLCDVYVEKNCYTAHTRSNLHRSNAFTVVDDGVEKIIGAFGDKIVSYRVYDPSKDYIDVKEFTHNIREKVINLIDSIIVVHNSIKINLELYGLYFLLTNENTEIKSFNTKNRIITPGSNFYDIYDGFIDDISTKMSEFQERDSGWTLCKILHIEVNINKFNPMKASSFIDLPESIKHKKAIINVQNNDDACFAWAITSALRNPTGLPQRTSSYPDYNTVADFTEIVFPTKLKDISIFERKNNISVNVYGLEKHFKDYTYEVVGPLHFSKHKKIVHINLLMLCGENGETHYCWIKNLSRLVSTQRSQHGHQKYICEGCLTHFSSPEKLRRHENEDCVQIKAVMPGTDYKVDKFGHEVLENILQFENFEKQLRVPFIVYADFESILEPIHTTEPNPSKPYTVRCYEHEPYSFAYYIKCNFNENLSKLQVYRGHNASAIFVKKLEKEVKRIYNDHLSVVKEMIPLTAVEQSNHNECNTCHICEKIIVNLNEKVCDHDHQTGVYRGPAHMTCNINYKDPNFIPVVFHNLSNYDSHLFVKSLALNKEDISVIAQNKEKYITFSKKICVGDKIDITGKKRKVFYKMKFIDSFRFMNSSIEKLSSYLDTQQFRETKRYYDGEKFELIRQKGVFPYQFLTSIDLLSHPTLPEKDKFYDILSDTNVSDENYSRAERVWEIFGCQTLGDYSDIYNQSDVLLLADVFENFRDLCMSNYKLDPAHYLTAPGLSWDAMLRMTGVKLELLTDIDMLHFFKMGIRGGVSTCCKRMDFANNEYLPNYDVTKPKKWITYLDATNLYGYAMSFKLPIDQFRWLSVEELAEIDISSIPDDSDFGYVFEVDLAYPVHLHDDHNDFPFCPENVIPPTSKYPKLIPNLINKKNYVIHYLTLKQCLKHGLELQYIRRGIKFRQANWLKNYVDFNTIKRNEATNEFGKQYYKLLINSIFGKTMENVENRVDIKLVSHWESRYKKLGAEAYIAKPQFKSSKVFTENLVAIELALIRIHYTKPVFVGYTILEVAKLIMYDFFYEYLKPQYGEDVSLLYTDTDSLILSISNHNFYEDMRANLDRFDTSNFPDDNVYNIPRGLPRLGKMKDEFGGKIIECFFGTGAKAYCVKLLNETCKTAKGVRKYVINKHLTVNDYRDVIESGGVVYKKMYTFRSDYHTIYTELINKVALTGTDDKRYILEDKCNTLAYGHHRIDTITRQKNLDELIAAIAEEGL